MRFWLIVEQPDTHVKEAFGIVVHYSKSTQKHMIYVCGYWFILYFKYRKGRYTAYRDTPFLTSQSNSSSDLQYLDNNNWIVLSSVTKHGPHYVSRVISTLSIRSTFLEPLTFNLLSSIHVNFFRLHQKVASVKLVPLHKLEHNEWVTLFPIEMSFACKILFNSQLNEHGRVCRWIQWRSYVTKWVKNDSACM